MSQEKFSSRIIITDGERVALTRNRGNNKIKTVGGRMEAGENPPQAAAREFIEEIGTSRRAALESRGLVPNASDFKELPKQIDTENNAYWNLLIVPKEVLSILEGVIPEEEDADAAEILLVDINEVINQFTYPLWRSWWEELGKEKVLESIR